MILDIKPMEVPYTSCLEKVYLLFLQSRNFKQIEPLFEKVWSFYLQDTDDILGVRLSSDRTGKWLNKLVDDGMEYFGYRMNWYDIEYFEQYDEIIRKNLAANMPVCVCLNSFYCPWQKGYQEYDLPHYVLVIGIDEHTGGYYCMDHHKTPQFLSVENLAAIHQTNDRLIQTFGGSVMNRFAECATFLPCEKKEVQPQKIIKFAIEAVRNGADGRSDFASMQKFAEDYGLQKTLEPEIWKENENYHLSLFLRPIEQISWGRYWFGNHLAYLQQLDPTIPGHELKEDFHAAHDKWETISRMFLKNCYAPDNQHLLQSTTRQLFEIAEFEEAIFNKMSRIFHC